MHHSLQKPTQTPRLVLSIMSDNKEYDALIVGLYSLQKKTWNLKLTPWKIPMQKYMTTNENTLIFPVICFFGDSLIFALES